MHGFLISVKIFVTFVGKLQAVQNLSALCG